MNENMEGKSSKIKVGTFKLPGTLCQAGSLFFNKDK
jgi:hypothetical protein